MSNDGFIMDLWERIFMFLSKISVFTLIKKFVWTRIENKYRFVEYWVIGNLGFSIITALLIYNINNRIFMTIILGYSMIRVFEIVIYQINVILFDPYRAEKRGEKYKVKSISRMLVLLAHNYVEIIFWYVVMTLSVLKLNNTDVIFSLAYYIKASFLCMATFNNELLVANGSFLGNVAFAEVFSGIILTIISIARFIGILPAVDEDKE